MHMCCYINIKCLVLFYVINLFVYKKNFIFDILLLNKMFRESTDLGLSYVKSLQSTILIDHVRNDCVSK